MRYSYVDFLASLTPPPQLSLFQETEQEWADFTLCSLIVESQSAEVLMVDASIFNDVIYPGTDLRYDMEVRVCVYYVENACTRRIRSSIYNAACAPRSTTRILIEQHC